MNPATVDIKDVLEAETDLSFGSDLFIGSEPDSPNNVITLYDTGGGQPDFVQYRKPSVQVRCRNTSYPNGWAKINEVIQTLLTARGRTPNSTYNTAWWLQSDIMFIQQDDKNRYVFTANIRGHRSD